MKSFQNTMAAAAFAEAGEFETARNFMENAGQNSKKVILGVDDPDIKPKVINYALELCERVEGQLEVLHILKPVEDRTSFRYSLKAMVEMLTSMGIPYKLAFGSGKLEDELIRHTADNRNILLVVLNSVARKGKEACNVLRIMDALHCPVVVFSDKI